MENKPVIVAVSGLKNSGKTTLITQMLPVFSAAGLRTAVIKHDGHLFRPDPPDTDTGRFMAAGALGTAIFDRETCKVIRRQTVTEEYLTGQFPEADLILLEGFKFSAWPKLELVRPGNSPVCSRETLLALVTDLPIDLPGVPRIAFGNAEKAAAVILQYMTRKENGHIQAPNAAG